MASSRSSCSLGRARTPLQAGQGRLSPGLLLCVSALLLGSLAAAQNPTQFLWDPEASAYGEVGGTPPARLTGRPTTGEPLSLLTVKGRQVRLLAASPDVASFHRRDGGVMDWRSDLWSSETAAPWEDGGNRWAAGLGVERLHDGFLYRDDLEAADYRGTKLETRLRVALATERGPWRFGGMGEWSKFSLNVSGASVAPELELPPEGELPRVAGPATGGALAVSRDLGNLDLAVQYRWSQPRPRLTLQYDFAHLSSDIDGQIRSLDVSLTRERGSHADFLLARHSDYDYAGAIRTGLMIRGDLDISAQDLNLALGRRWQSPRGLRQLMLDWRELYLEARGNGSAGILPGVAGEVFILRADGHSSVISLRYTHEWPLRPRWSLVLGSALQRSVTSGGWRLRRLEALGTDPVLVDEYRVRDGTINALILTPSFQYRTPQWDAVFGFTVGLPESHNWERVGAGPEPSARPQIARPRLMYGLGLTHRF